MSSSPAPMEESIAAKKRKMTLDFGSASTKSSQSPSQASGAMSLFPSSYSRPSPCGPVFLTSPDVMMLAISTPEVERILFQGLIGPKTPSPTGMPAGAPRNPASLAEEQDLYSKGFADAMAYSSSLHAAQMGALLESSRAATNYPMFPSPFSVMHSTASPLPHQHQPPRSPKSAGFKILPLPQLTLNNSASNSPKEERAMSAFVPHSAVPIPSVEPASDRSSRSPSNMSDSESAYSEHAQTVPSPSSSFSSSCHHGFPDSVMAVSDALMDVDNSCRERNDVRRERNRIAAARCRQRKMDKIWVLEERIRDLKGQNDSLTEHADKLRGTLISLKRELRQHLQSGCNVFGGH